MQPAFALARPFKKVANATFRAKLGATRRNRAQPDATPCTMPRKGLRSKLPSWRDFRKKPESLLHAGCRGFESLRAYRFAAIDPLAIQAFVWEACGASG